MQFVSYILKTCRLCYSFQGVVTNSFAFHVFSGGGKIWVEARGVLLERTKKNCFRLPTYFLPYLYTYLTT